MGFHLRRAFDYASHNAEVDRVWQAYNERRPCRVPVRPGASITNLLCNPALRLVLTAEPFQQSRARREAVEALE